MLGGHNTHHPRNCKAAELSIIRHESRSGAPTATGNAESTCRGMRRLARLPARGVPGDPSPACSALDGRIDAPSCSTLTATTARPTSRTWRGLRVPRRPRGRRQPARVRVAGRRASQRGPRELDRRAASTLRRVRTSMYVPQRHVGAGTVRRRGQRVVLYVVYSTGICIWESMFWADQVITSAGCK